MDKPLTIDDFKDMEIPSEWGGMQQLCLIAKFLTEKFDSKEKGCNAKGKAVMIINECCPQSPAGKEVTMRSKRQSNNKSIKINVTPVLKSRQNFDKKRGGGGELQFLPVKDQSCSGRQLTDDFPSSITVEDTPPATKKVTMNSKRPGKRIKLNVTPTSINRELFDKGDQFCGNGRDDGGQETHHQLPLNFQATIREMGGSDCRLVLEKTLSRSDVAKDQARFSIPLGKLRSGSLDSEAKRLAATEKGTAVRFIEPSGKELKDMQLIFKEWTLTNSSNYVLNGKWNPVVQRNGLKVHDLVHLWSFRVGTELGFALVNLTQQETKRTMQREEEEEEEEVKSDGDS